MATKNAINSNIPIEVSKGGTANVNLTDHGVLVGSGTGAITPIAVGATGTLLVGAVGADPAFSTSAIGDFTFTSSTASQTRILTVTNTDDTGAATSAARLDITVGGANVADPQIKYTVTGQTTFSTGIDNSDSDKFKISASSGLGTTDVLISTTAGEITMPLQPSFLAVNTAGNANVTGDSTVYTLTFPSEIYDQNSDFDGTSTFTAPVTGCYFFSWGITLDDLAAGMWGNARLVASNRTMFTPNDIGAGTIKTPTDQLQFWSSSYVDMDAADTATIGIQIVAGGLVVDIVGGATSDPVTFFSGSLVC